MSNSAVPASFGQEMLWLVDRVSNAGAAYNIPYVSRLRGRLFVEALQHALDDVVERHPVLRSALRLSGDTLLQIPSTASAVHLRRWNLSNEPLASREERARAIVTTELETPFDLSAAPLLRAGVIALDDFDHVFYAIVHHAAFDGGSGPIFGAELAERYRLHVQGCAERPEPSSAYADFARRQRDAVEHVRHAEEYWIAELAGIPDRIALPTTRPHPRSQSHGGGRRNVSVSAADVERLQRLARREQATLYTALLSVFAILLHRFSGQDDIVIGTGVDGRDSSDLEGAIGFCVSTVAIRSRPPEGSSYLDVLAHLRANVHAAAANHRAPFHRLVSQLSITPTLAHHPVFQTWFALEDETGSAVDFDGLHVAEFEIPCRTTKFDLVLTLRTMYDGALGGYLEYNTDVFDAEAIDELSSAFTTLAHGCAVQSEVPLRQLALGPRTTGPLRSSPQRVTMSCDFVDELIARRASDQPDRVAVVCRDVEISYGELLVQADSIASTLVAAGIGPESVVAVHMDRSIGLVAAVLGTLRAGAAFLPIDPELPDERRRLMIESSGAAAILTNTDAAGGVACTIVRHRANVSDGRERSSESLAYVLYTSGSTGYPKGAMIAHASLTNRITWMLSHYGLTPNERVLQKTPIAFDVFVYEVLWPLAAGAALVVADAGGHRDAQYLAKTIEEQAINVVHFVPSMLRAFLDQGTTRDVSSVRAVLCGGESLTLDVARRFHDAFDARLWHQYGPTEATIAVSYCEITRDTDRITIGTPIANCALWVLDELMHVVPVGVVGELYVGGLPVGRGYLNGPGATAERFLPDPLGSAGGRVYRTGDLARLCRDGSVEFLGRVDTQLKIRGFRVEPAEIERVLREDDRIGDCAVISRVTNGEPELAAFVVLRAHATRAELHATVAAQLPQYMCPSHWYVLDALPLSLAGKVDRLRLQDAHTSAPLSEGGRSAYGSETERRLAALWSQVLGRGDAAAGDDFFAAGGHSLKAIQLANRVRSEFAVDLSVADVFTFRTLRGMATRIDDLQDVARPLAIPKLARSASGTR